MVAPVKTALALVLAEYKQLMDKYATLMQPHAIVAAAEKQRRINTLRERLLTVDTQCRHVGFV